MKDDQVIRQQIVQLLDGRNAHYTFDDAIEQFPMEHINTRPPDVPYTPWHIIEHLRISQWDILEFMRDPDHVSPNWPEGYWPSPEATTDEEQWQESIDQFHTDMESIKELAMNSEIELSAEIPHAPGYTYVREFLLVADHNAYHVGEFAILRQIMGTWHQDRKF
jgi:hypothetical protein